MQKRGEKVVLLGGWPVIEGIRTFRKKRDSRPWTTLKKDSPPKPKKTTNENVKGSELNRKAEREEFMCSRIAPECIRNLEGHLKTNKRKKLT